jgi:hypothetical protein
VSRLRKALAVTVAGETIYLTTRGGFPRLAEGSSSEQCEGCGADIIESGRVRLYSPRLDAKGCHPDEVGTLECQHCQTRYQVRHVLVREPFDSRF